MSSYGRGRPRGADFFDGCLTNIGWAVAFAFGVFAVVGGGVWLFSPPDKICSRFDEIKVIEQVDIGTRTAPTLVTKKVCAEWKVVEP